MFTANRPLDLAKGIEIRNRDGVTVRHFATPTVADAERAYKIATAIRERNAKDYSVHWWVVPESADETVGA